MKNNTVHLQGCWTALVTPFLKAEVDWRSLENLVRSQLQGGVDGLVVLGTTAETPTLSEIEQRRILERVTRWAAGKTKIMIGCGSNSTQKTMELARRYEAYKPAAFLVVTPYYNKPGPRGLIEHFTAVARCVKTPVVIYNVPSRTGVNMLPDAVLETARRCRNVLGIKEASGQLDQASVLCRQALQKFCVLSGDDSLTLPMMAVGAHGVVSVASNVAPKEVRAMVHAALEGKFDIARKMHLRLMPLFKDLFMETNPVPVKAALASMGVIRSARVRPPLVPLAKANRDKLLNVLKEGNYA